MAQELDKRHGIDLPLEVPLDTYSYDRKIQKIARQLSLNEVQFEKHMKDPKILARISQDIRDGTKVGVTGSPTIFINGRLLRRRSLEEFRVIIERELERIKKGVGP